jgi:glycosyltransferase involved in cell wall biosynthesis
MPEILRHEPNFLVLIAGWGPLQSELQALIEQLGVSQSVRLLGYAKEIRNVLESADLYIQPSLCETTGFALLEAGGLGLPLLGSRAGGIPEVIVEGVNGLLFPPRDPQGIAEAVLKLARNPELRRQCGIAARERVRREFHPADMISATTKVYLRMLES